MLKQIYGFLGYCDRGVAQTGPGTTGARKEEGKKGSGWIWPDDVSLESLCVKYLAPH